MSWLTRAASRPRGDDAVERGHGVGAGEAELAMEVAQGDDGRRVFGDGVERTGGVG